MRVIGRDEVRRLLPQAVCIPLMREALAQVARGEAIQPLRQIMALPGDRGRGLGLMPGHLADPGVFGCKVTAVYPENHDRGLQSHRGVVLLFDEDGGAPLAALHGGEITAIRTAAASAVATDLLARPDASRLAVLGYGEQAAEHVASMLAVRPVAHLTVWGRDPERARAFTERMGERHGLAAVTAPSPAEAVAGADIVCTVTGAMEPILRGEALSPGLHLNVVGSSIAAAREIDGEAVRRARFFVDYRPMALAQAGELLAAIGEGLVDEAHVLAEIGAVAMGAVAGRTSSGDITLFKSLGCSAEDLACARYLYARASAEGGGTQAVFD